MKHNCWMGTPKECYLCTIFQWFSGMNLGLLYGVYLLVWSTSSSNGSLAILELAINYFNEGIMTTIGVPCKNPDKSKSQWDFSTACLRKTPQKLDTCHTLEKLLMDNLNSWHKGTAPIPPALGSQWEVTNVFYKHRSDGATWFPVASIRFGVTLNNIIMFGWEAGKLVSAG